MIAASPGLFTASDFPTIVAIVYGDAVSVLALARRSGEAKRAAALRSPSFGQWVVRMMRDDS